MENWKVDIESENLKKYEKICSQLIAHYAKKNRPKINVFEERKIKRLLERMFENELDYLHNEPEDYFELYGDDHLQN
jgi:hypothetical protein